MHLLASSPSPFRLIRPFSARRQFSCRARVESPPHPPASAAAALSSGEKKSLAVATGELFLGLAALLVRRGAKPSASPAPAVIWEQPAAAETETARPVLTSPGFSFSAAGLLFPYHLGVADYLLAKGYIKETTPLAGASAGAIICAVIASGNAMRDALKVTKTLAENCRQKGTAFRLGAVLRAILNEFFPEDVHIRCNGRVRIAVTQVLWRPRAIIVDQFNSKEDVINAVITSSFIPGYLAPRPVTLFRNRVCIDGGLTLFMPPTSAPDTVRVCAFPASRLGIQGIGISPDCNPENRAGPRQLFNWALEPADDEVLDWLYELGSLDAAVWAEQNPVDLILNDEVKQQQQLECS